MTYNGYVADLFFNACAIAMWAAFLWRVLDGPRFRVWVTVLLAALIGAAYMAATLLLTTVGQLRAHMDKGYLVIQESNPVRPRQPQGKKPRRIPELERGVGFRVLGGLAAKYDGSFRHTCENDTYTVTLSLRAG